MGQDFKINDCGEIIRKRGAKNLKPNWWSIVSLFLFIAVCIVSYICMNLMRATDSLNWELSDLNNINSEINAELQMQAQKINLLQEELFLIREDGFGIYSIEFGNNDYYGNTLTEYDHPLYSSEMRYLMPRLIYYATGTKNVTFQYKIFYPDGTLVFNSDYSEEFTGSSHNVTLYAGNKNIVELGGWGNSSESIYQSGTYTIEIWYNGRCVKKQYFEILQ